MAYWCRYGQVVLLGTRDQVLEVIALRVLRREYMLMDGPGRLESFYPSLSYLNPVLSCGMGEDRVRTGDRQRNIRLPLNGT